MNKLELINGVELRNEFNYGIKELKNKILNKIKYKKVNNININGNMLISIVNNYIECINSNQLPIIQNAWIYMCNNKCDKLIYNIINDLDNHIKYKLNNILPITKDGLDVIWNEYINELINNFNK